jgi:beta-galactosidase
MKTLPTLAAWIFLVGAAIAGEAPRERLLMDDNWQFKIGKPTDSQGKFDKAGFGPAMFKGATVSVPHDWAVELPFAKSSLDKMGYKAIGVDFRDNSIGWYAREFTVQTNAAGRRFWLEFDGVFRDCQVWVNGIYYGRHESGYSSFRYDITDAVDPGQKNNVIVRVDATLNEGWFYEGAGIYRHVWLTSTDPLAVVPDGVFVYSRFAHNEPVGAAEVWAEVSLRNDYRTNQKARVKIEVLDSKGQSVGSASAEASVDALAEALLKQKVNVEKPELWSPETPVLYKLVTTVETGDRVVDRVETPFGIRTVAFDSNEGFKLNGKKYTIKGTSNHQDFAGVGVALPDALQVYKIKRLKEIGCNGYRAAHNPPSPELLDACDRLGMLVMDENRLMVSSPEQQNQLERLIRRDRNHPSIFIWSIGNEEIGIQKKPVSGRIARTLTDICHRLDPTRLVTYAANDGNRYEGANKVVDVRGWNYWGWQAREDYHAAHPQQPNIMTEYGHAQGTRGIYFGTDEELKAKGCARDAGGAGWWPKFLAQPFASGIFPWTGFDYRGEPGQDGSWPQINGNFGVLDLCGFPKAGAYIYQAIWCDKPMIKILPDWSLPDKINSEIPVWVYSSADEVELIVNDMPVGRSKPVAGRADFKVRYQPGVAVARGYRDGKLVIETRSETAGAASILQVEPDRTNLAADGQDVAVVNVRIADDKGRFVPAADNLVEFSLTGPGRIIGVGNGDPLSQDSEKEPRRKAFNGLCQVLVQTTQTAGEIELKASSADLKPMSIKFQAHPPTARPSVP